MIQGNFVLEVTHVAGTRIMGEGTDGLSRGEVHAHDLMNHFAHTVPLHKGAVERVPKLTRFLIETFGDDVLFAKPADWFEEATQQFDFSMKSKTWIWDLPPSAAIHMLEELGLGRNKKR